MLGDPEFGGRAGGFVSKTSQHRVALAIGGACLFCLLWYMTVTVAIIEDPINIKAMKCTDAMVARMTRGVEHTSATGQELADTIKLLKNYVTRHGSVGCVWATLVCMPYTVLMIQGDDGWFIVNDPVVAYTKGTTKPFVVTDENHTKKVYLAYQDIGIKTASIDGGTSIAYPLSGTVAACVQYAMSVFGKGQS